MSMPAEVCLCGGLGDQARMRRTARVGVIVVVTAVRNCIKRDPVEGIPQGSVTVVVCARRSKRLGFGRA